MAFKTTIQIPTIQSVVKSTQSCSFFVAVHCIGIVLCKYLLKNTFGLMSNVSNLLQKSSKHSTYVSETNGNTKDTSE